MLTASLDLQFWNELVASANACRDFVEKSFHLNACLLTLEIGGEPRWFELHRGGLRLHKKRPPQGPAFTIAGERAAWFSLLSGETQFAQAISKYGQLRVSGNALELTWCLPALNQLFRIAAKIGGEGAND